MAGAGDVKAGGAYVEIEGRDAKLDRTLERSRGKLRKFGAAAIGVAKAFAIAGAAMSVPIIAAIEKAGAFQERLSKFNAVFKELAPAAREWAEGFSEKLGRSKSDIVSFMATLQDTFVPLGFAREEGFALAKALTQLTVDVASFNDKADADVLRDFQSTLVGNHETVRKYGIIVNDAALNVELLRMGIAKGAKGASNAQKVQARFNLILAGTTDAQGDAERTANSYANTKKRLASEIERVAITLGTEMIPMATKAMNAVIGFTKRLTDAKIASRFAQIVFLIEDSWLTLTSRIGETILLIQNMWSAMSNAMATVFLWSAEKIVSAMSSMAREFLTTIDGLITAINHVLPKSRELAKWSETIDLGGLGQDRIDGIKKALALRQEARAKEAAAQKQTLKNLDGETARRREKLLAKLAAAQQKAVEKETSTRDTGVENTLQKMAVAAAAGPVAAAIAGAGGGGAGVSGSTVGTFSAFLGGRMAGPSSIDAESLNTEKKMLDKLSSIDRKMGGAVFS